MGEREACWGRSVGGLQVAQYGSEIVICIRPMSLSAVFRIVASRDLHQTHKILDSLNVHEIIHSALGLFRWHNRHAHRLARFVSCSRRRIGPIRTRIASAGLRVHPSSS